MCICKDGFGRLDEDCDEDGYCLNNPEGFSVIGKLRIEEVTKIAVNYDAKLISEFGEAVE